MTRILVWDLVVRLFHFGLAFGVLSAAFIAIVLGEHGALFPYHAIIGLTVGFMVVLRLLWGLVGTRYARLSALRLSPLDVIRYFRGVLSGHPPRHLGHNPATSHAIIIMFALILGLAATGLLMAVGATGLKDLHEILSYSLVGVVCAHILGVLIHAIQVRDGLPLSMVTGYKLGTPDQPIRSSQPLAAGVFLLLSVSCAATLVRTYTSSTQTIAIPLLGTVLQLGEAPEGGHGDRSSGRDHIPDEDD